VDILAIAAGLVTLWLLLAVMTAIERMQPTKPQAKRRSAGKPQGTSPQRPGR